MMGFLRFMQFLLALTLSAFVYTNFAMGKVIDEFDVAPDIYEVHLDKSDFDTLGEAVEDDRYPGDDRDFRCQIVVVIVDLENDYKRERFNFWGSGNSWSDSRNSAFQRYGRYINTGGFWRSRYNHSFAFKNCRG